MKKLLALCCFLVTFTSALADKPFNASLVPDIAIFDKTTKITGLTLSIWGENETHGVSLGLVNGTRGDSAGFCWGIVNYADKYTGVLLGAVNYAKTGFAGLQLGLVNVAAGPVSGVQIGLINVIQSTKSFFGEMPKALAPFFILFNWRVA